MSWFTRRALALGLSGTLLAGTLIGGGTALAASSKKADFDLVVSKGGSVCLPNASGEVHIRSVGPVEIMDVSIDHALPKSEFDLFILQLPTAPFGVSWYQSDIRTNDEGHGHVRVIGRFSEETFAVAPGVGPAPTTFDSHPVDDEGNSIASADKNAQFVLCPYTNGGEKVRFRIPPRLARTTHRFTWKPDSVACESLTDISGGRPRTGVIERHTFTRDIPRPGGENARINLWLVAGGAPAGDRDLEVIVDRFEFTAAEPTRRP